MIWPGWSPSFESASDFASGLSFYHSHRRKFRSQTSDNTDRWKSRGGKSQRGEEKKWEDQRRERERRKKMQVREKVLKSWFTVFLQWFGAPEGQKVTSLKRRVRSHLARWEMKTCTPLWCKAHFEVKTCYKADRSRITFGSWDVEKVQAVVAQSTFPSQNVQSTPFSEHFWKFRCPKSASWCGAKHVSKSKCTKHTILGTFLEVQMSKKCTLMWRKARFEVKMYKAHHSRTTFGRWGVEKAHAVRTTFWRSDVEKVRAVVAWSTFRSQKRQKPEGFGALLGGSDVVIPWEVQGILHIVEKWAKREGL